LTVSLNRDPHAPMGCLCVCMTDRHCMDIACQCDRDPTPHGREKVSRPITDSLNPLFLESGSKCLFVMQSIWSLYFE